MPLEILFKKASRKLLIKNAKSPLDQQRFLIPGQGDENAFLPFFLYFFLSSVIWIRPVFGLIFVIFWLKLRFLGHF